MAMRKTLRVSKQMGVENHDVLKKTRQSSVLPLTTQRRALNEIGNVVRQHVQAPTNKVISKDKQKAALRRSSRLSLAQPLQQSAAHPRKVRRVTAKPKETPVTDERPVAPPRSKVRMMGPPSAAPANRDRCETSVEPAKRESTVVPVRAPRLTMKPPPVETPPEERIAAQNLIRQSLAVERSRRFTMAVTMETQRILIPRDIVKALLIKPNIKKKEEPKIPIEYDIELMHRHCFWMVPTYSKQVYAYLQRLDRRMATKIAQQRMKSTTETARQKLVDWMASAYLQLQLLQDTFQLGVSILDRYLLQVTDIKEASFQLLAVTCLSLSIKYEELLTNSVKELLSLSSRRYTIEEYVAMESEIIKVLDFQVARPVPLVFLRRYNTAAKCGRTQHSYGKYLIDLAQLDLNLARLPASSLAAAAAFIGITLQSRRVDPEAWNPIMVHYSALAFDEIKPIVSQMARLAMPGGPQSKAVRRKYVPEAAYFSTDVVQHLLLALHNLSYT